MMGHWRQGFQVWPHPYVNLYKYRMKINLLLSFLLLLFLLNLLLLLLLVILIIIIITTIISVITITFIRLLNAVDEGDEGCFLWIADHQSPESQKGMKVKNFKSIYCIHNGNIAFLNMIQINLNIIYLCSLSLSATEVQHHAGNGTDFISVFKSGCTTVCGDIWW